MADERITALAALGAAPAAGDLIEVVDISDTSMAATGTNKKMTVTELFSAIPVPIGLASTFVQTSASASAFVSGLNGATNPVLKIDNSIASQADGIQIQGQIAQSGTHIAAISSGGNSSIKVFPKGAGGLLVGAGVVPTTTDPIAGADLFQVSTSAALFGFNINSGEPFITVSNGTVKVFGGHANSTDGATFGSFSNHVLTLRTNNTNRLSITAAGITNLGSAGVLGFSSNANPVSAAADSGISRISAGLIAIGTGAAASRAGWMQWAGQAYLAADGTNATATLATTGLSVNVTTGRKYGFRCILYVSDSVAAEGVQIDFAGGSATETNFRAQATGFDSALALSTQLDDLADVASAATFTGNGMIEINGTFEPSSTGTFIPRFAQASHVTGTLTIFRGSHLLMWDMP